jgi:hypothetical protein
LIYALLQSAAIAPLLQGQQSWTPAVLTKDQVDSLSAIGERIIPGSAAAQCTRVIDLILTVESDDVRAALVASIGLFDSAAQKRYGNPFKRLRPEEQDALLAGNEDHAFALIKEWMSDTYWSSKDGLRELGWNGQQAWSAVRSTRRAR